MGNDNKKWWQQYTRVIQTNLQIRDTHLIDPESLSQQIQELGGNVLVFNVGGIYAWYESKVKYHHINEYLPKDRDLLKEVIAACHKRGIRFVGRFDFSKTDDYVYQEHPDWFACDKEGKPLIIGAQRPGPWSLLYSTCINSSYWNEAVASPILEEVLEQYDLDGIFFNATFPPVCWCDNCRRKYTALYGKSMPDSQADFDPSWRSYQMRDNITGLNSVIKEKRNEIPLILYYWDQQLTCDCDSLAELTCDESQDYLSRGCSNIPDIWRPLIRMKQCSAVSKGLPPFGIIHSSPGMDWRHTGLPPAEYNFWLSQVPANGGSVWHSLTGIPDTIPDKRILECVRKSNEMIKLVEPAMSDARPVSQIALLWDEDCAKEGWMKAFLQHQIPFGILEKKQITLESLNSYKAVVIPGGFSLTQDIADAICEYTKSGGNILLEGKLSEEFPELFELCGIKSQQKQGEYFVSSYLRFEEEGCMLQEGGLENTPFIAFQGQVAYSQPVNASVLATLIPPFAPLEAVGAPPERASILTPHTDIPLCLYNRAGKGSVITITFNLSALIMNFALGEHALLASRLIHLMVGQKMIEVTCYQGLQVSMFSKDGSTVIHLVNGSGHRPLVTCLPLHGIHVAFHVPDGKKVDSVRALIGEREMIFTQENDKVCFTVDTLEVWEAVEITYRGGIIL